MNRKINVAIVGATGIVGQELISILQERRFPLGNLKLLASENSAGEKIEAGDEELTVEALGPDSFQNIDIAFLAVDGSLAQKVVDWCKNTKTICIDKSSAFRLDPEVPLVIPEVNAHEIANYSKKNIIACPNCTSTPLAQILLPLHQKAGLKRVIVCSYQAVSGAGRAGMEELDKQTRDLFNMRESEPTVFSNRIAFNVLPYIPEEEEKLVSETRRLLELPELNIAATCVRVPVFNAHSAAMHLEFERAISPEEACEILSQSKGLQVVDDLSQSLYPMPLDASGGDMTLVGRIRADNSVPHGLAAWYSSDNLRTGAALNAVKIAEILCKEYLK
ncbi:MAG: aspartate-semialdehyde dehydrogenase [Myxococcaceae bacterium]